jgi:hypothetical protein
MSTFRLVYTTKDVNLVLRHDLYINDKMALVNCDYETAMNYIRDQMKPGDGYQYEEIENNFVTEIIDFESMMKTFELEKRLRKGEL